MIMSALAKHSLAKAIREWLGDVGIAHFREYKKKYGTVSPVIGGNPPHAVHFREGMTVRNKLRELTNYVWTAHQYDDIWAEIVEAAIEE